MKHAGILAGFKAGPGARLMFFQSIRVVVALALKPDDYFQNVCSDDLD
ncbi:MAG: hypothetical protein IPP59_10390 [Betaproteobacteria bacterium]|nr:hypothetical protein [Betaproteobacteria bacterium]MBK9784555.1 hypothetical protein [Candidatus Dechloromonas phosphorivorans]